LDRKGRKDKICHGRAVGKVSPTNKAEEGRSKKHHLDRQYQRPMGGGRLRKGTKMEKERQNWQRELTSLMGAGKQEDFDKIGEPRTRRKLKEQGKLRAPEQ